MMKYNIKIFIIIIGVLSFMVTLSFGAIFLNYFGKTLPDPIDIANEYNISTQDNILFNGTLNLILLIFIIIAFIIIVIMFVINNFKQNNNKL